MTDILTIVKDVGVPAAITLIILLRIEPRLDRMNTSLLMLPEKLHNLINGHQPDNPESHPPTSGGT